MLPRGFVPLPSTAYVVPKRSQSLQTLAEAFVYWIALGMKATYERRQTEVYFVSIVVLSETKTQFNFDFFCPYQDLINFLKQNLHTGLTAQDVIRMNSQFDYKVIRRMGIHPDTPTPLVIVFDPSRKEIQFVNENQLKAPGQFLRPRNATTTSDFLNFIGTMSLHNDAGRTMLVDDMETVKRLSPPQWWKWFRHLSNESVIFDPGRIFVHADKPEEYFYDYEEDA